MAQITQTQFDRVHEAWPKVGLERVLQCPVCKSKYRTLLHDGLRDWVFYCAPGDWALYSCTDCGSGYLDPRPNEQTIHLAYERYYTHGTKQKVESPSLTERMRRCLANGYRNWRYGTLDSPESSFGVVAAALWPSGRAIIDNGMRHLPRVSAGQRLLDVGCGDGAFLRKAKSAGWDVMGLDFDEVSVKLAQSYGLNVLQGNVATLQNMAGCFNTITMGHVIEHVPDPVDVLRRCFDLLEPGGTIWLDTPNINALGHKRYGRAWRGLEPPRHLVLFSVESLLHALSNSGFECPIFPPYRPVAHSTYPASEAILLGVDPYDHHKVTAELQKEIREAVRHQMKNVNVREFITVKATKPYALASPRN